MLQRLVGDGTSAGLLKSGLTASAERARGIGSRVANAANGSGDFGSALEQAQAGNAGTAAIDIEQEMVSLADEQLRFEASVKLLQKVYAQVRASVRER